MRERKLVAAQENNSAFKTLLRVMLWARWSFVVAQDTEVSIITIFSDFISVLDFDRGDMRSKTLT